MARIRALNLTGDKAYLDSVRDVFLFCCFSGVRHSDANNLRKSDIKDDHLEITTMKTADSISIELNDVTKAILEKYKAVPFSDGKALPNLTNQAMNRDVKEICKLAGIIMKWTGHADYASMKPYIDIVDSIKAESMTKFNNLL